MRTQATICGSTLSLSGSEPRRQRSGPPHALPQGKRVHARLLTTMPASYKYVGVCAKGQNGLQCLACSLTQEVSLSWQQIARFRQSAPSNLSGEQTWQQGCASAPACIHSCCVAVWGASLEREGAGPGEGELAEGRAAGHQCHRCGARQGEHNNRHSFTD